MPHIDIDRNKLSVNTFVWLCLGINVFSVKSPFIMYNHGLPPPPPNRETMLQALRFVIQGAGSKVDPAIRKNITTTLLGMLGHDEV